ncbi:MAG TPA: aminopeptidase P family protein [Geminicoccaceae bacterium]|nr:aminopeptidase P family protein [Geminicoccaceae bacterium]
MPVPSSAADPGLADLLRRAESPVEPAAVDDLLRATLAAPPGFEPDAWLELFGSDLSETLVAALRERRAALAAGRGAPVDPPLPERLGALRARLAELGVDGFVLQRTDEHGSEYLPAAGERVAWLTGFTGSAGQVVVLAERAAIFVDGRYTSQAAQQVDPERFEHLHVVDRPPSKWLESALPEGARLGFDPMLTKAAERQGLEKVVAARGGALVPLDANPVDAIWAGRPPAPVAPVRLLDERYAGESSAAKRQRMAAAIREKGAGWLVLTAADSIAWLLNVRGGDIPYNPLCLSFALLRDDGTCRWFVDPRKLPPGLRLDNAVIPEPADRFLAALDALGALGARVLVDPAAVHVGFTERLKRAGAVLVEGEDPCILAKATKNPVEIQGAVDAQRRDGAAMVRFLAWLDAQPHDGSLSEADAAARLLAERAKDPLFRGPSFETIPGHGPNAAIPHYRCSPESNRPIAAGTVFLIDSGGQYLDATTDVTRTVALGEVEPEVTERFTLVLAGHVAVAGARFPVGTSGAQLDTLARLPIWRAGLDFDHGTGHGIGSYLCVHEGPQRIAKTGSGVALKPGMIVSNEPGYYKAGAYGIRIENLVVVRSEPRPPGGERDLLAFDTLTLCPIDRRLIRVDLLSSNERDWVNDYHARVRAELGPLVDGAARDWLDAATRPI